MKSVLEHEFDNGRRMHVLSLMGSSASANNSERFIFQMLVSPYLIRRKRRPTPDFWTKYSSS